MDFALSLAAFASASGLHFILIDPLKRLTIIPDTDGSFPLASLVPEEYRIFITYMYLALLVAVFQIAAFVAIDLYHPRRGNRPYRELSAIIRGVVLGMTAVLALLFFYRGASYSRMVMMYSSAFSVLYISTGHFLLRMILNQLRKSGYNTRKVLIVGTGPNAMRLLEILQKHSIYGYKICGLIGPKSTVPKKLQHHVKGTLNQFTSLAKQLNPDMIVYALPHKQDTVVNLRKIMDFSDQEGIDFRIVPHMVELIAAKSRIEDMDGIPMMTIRDTPLHNGYNVFLKRIFDFCFSTIFLILTSPLFLLIAILIKITSPGPVFFTQERVGLDRKIFRVIKFRSMVVQTSASSDTTWGSTNDQRVTKLGNFLRKTSLDEIPQFINVFLGSMSIVGPRPERPHFVSEFKHKYNHYMRRHAAKAGITGWAQIQGLRGDTSIEKRFSADIYYIENWTFWLDLFIVFKTIPSMIQNPGQ